MALQLGPLGQRFHVNGSTGAGIFQGADLDARFQKVGHVELREVRREELTGASDDELLGCM